MGVPAFLIRDRRNLCNLHNPVFPVPFLQIFVLYCENVRGHLARHADIHQRPEDTFLTRRIRRGFQIPVLYGIFFELIYQVIQTFVLVCYCSKRFPFGCHPSRFKRIRSRYSSAARTSSAVNP